MRVGEKTQLPILSKGGDRFVGNTRVEPSEAMRGVVEDVAVVWLPDQSEPWYLMTDEEHLRAQVLSKVFARPSTTTL